MDVQGICNLVIPTSLKRTYIPTAAVAKSLLLWQVEFVVVAVFTCHRLLLVTISKLLHQSSVTGDTPRIASAMAESCQCRSFADLPADFVHLVFEQLGLLDVIAASQTCKFWKTVCDAGWELRATARWQHSTDRWDRMKQAGAWKKLYQARHQVRVPHPRLGCLHA